MKMNVKNTVFVIISAFLFSGCLNKNAPENIPLSVNTKFHQWYYFTADGFQKTSLPQASEIASLKPWSESFRVSQANCDSNGNGYLLVNRLGAVFFEEGKAPVLFQDRQLFSENSASNMFFSEGEAFFTLSKNTFFNPEASLEENFSNTQERPFLVRIDTPSRSFFPVLTYSDISLSYGGEITGTYFDGRTFISSVKTLENGKTKFTFLKYTPKGSLSSLSPHSQKGKIDIEETTKEEYRKVSSPSPFSSSPKRLTELLNSLPKNFDFSVTLKNTEGSSPRLYATNPEQENLTEAKAIIAPEWICAVFCDGTVYFRGALKDREIAGNSKTIAFKLPKLPEGYVYTDFCISYDTMAAGWEEKDFYKTGRSGFITVDLGEVLYGKD